MKLIKNQEYEIRYKGMDKYDSYFGPGTYTGKTNNIDGKVYGFLIPGSYDEIAWFGLEDIFEIKKFVGLSDHEPEKDGYGEDIK